MKRVHKRVVHIVYEAYHKIQNTNEYLKRLDSVSNDQSQLKLFLCTFAIGCFFYLSLSSFTVFAAASMTKKVFNLYINFISYPLLILNLSTLHNHLSPAPFSFFLHWGFHLSFVKRLISTHIFNVLCVLLSEIGKFESCILSVLHRYRFIRIVSHDEVEHYTITSKFTISSMPLLMYHCKMMKNEVMK